MSVSISMREAELLNGKYEVSVTDVLNGTSDPHYIGRVIIAHAAFFKNWFQVERPVAITYNDQSTVLNFTYEIASPTVMTTFRKYFNCQNGILRIDNIPAAGEYSDLYNALHGKLKTIRSINDKFGELSRLVHDIYSLHDVEVLRCSATTLRMEALWGLGWSGEIRAKYLQTDNGVRGMSIMAQALINEYLDPLIF